MAISSAGTSHTGPTDSRVGSSTRSVTVITMKTSTVRAIGQRGSSGTGRVSS